MDKQDKFHKTHFWEVFSDKMRSGLMRSKQLFENHPQWPNYNGLYPIGFWRLGMLLSISNLSVQLLPNSLSVRTPKLKVKELELRLFLAQLSSDVCLSLSRRLNLTEFWTLKIYYICPLLPIFFYKLIDRF